MVFKSPHANMCFNIRHEGLPQRHPITGDVIGPGLKRIAAEFGVHRGEFKYTDPLTGNEEIGADIAGGLFDTVAAQAAQGWTDEEREMVERHLMFKCEELPGMISLLSVPKATAPWPTYDTLTNYLKIATLADELGLVGEALAYERQEKNRKGVIEALEAKLAETAAEADLVAA